MGTPPFYVQYTCGAWDSGNKWGIEHKFEIAVHFYIDMVYLKAVKYIFNSRMRDRNNMKEA